jgi:membrane fusion protein (multidrug efflux system)
MLVDDAGSPPAAAGETHLPRRIALLRNRRLRLVTAGVAAALLGSFAVWWFAYRPFVTTEDARIAAPVVVVAPEGAGGRVERVLVREGQAVRAGEPLVELDAATERAGVDRARALVAQAEARVGEAEAQLALERRLAQAAQGRARAGVRSARAAHRLAAEGARAEELARARAERTGAEALAAQRRRDLDRAEGLAREDAVSAADLEAARTAEAAARASLEARRAALDQLEHGTRPEDLSIARGGVLQAEAGLLEADGGADRVNLRTRQLDEARAQAAQARAELVLAEVALARRTLASSVGGVVVRVVADPGDLLAPGQGAVTVVDVEHAWVAANVEETAAGGLRPGQPATIAIDEGGELTGHVEVVAQAAASQFALIPADNAAGNFTKVVQRIPVRIAIDPSPRVPSLRVGQSVVVQIRG